MSSGKRIALRGLATKLGISILVLAWACSDSPVGPPNPIEQLPRSLTVQEELVLAGSNTFGLSLLKEVDARRESSNSNTILSPLSASLALGMAMEGADGETFTEMRDALGFQGMTREAVNSSYHGIMELLVELDPAVELLIANSAWARQGTPFEAAFFDAVTTHFDAMVQELEPHLV